MKSIIKIVIFTAIVGLAVFIAFNETNLFQIKEEERFTLRKDGEFDCQVIEKNIGDPHEGGKIAYCNNDGSSGLISTGTDQSQGVPWGCHGVGVSETKDAYGSGKDNTEAILKDCGDRPIAASVCLSLSRENFDDWFLPSKEELNYLYSGRHRIGGFGTTYYWSSSENRFASAWRQNFNLGTQNTSLKSGSYRVRCVRYF